MTFICTRLDEVRKINVLIRIEKRAVGAYLNGHNFTIIERISVSQCRNLDMTYVKDT